MEGTKWKSMVYGQTTLMRMHKQMRIYKPVNWLVLKLCWDLNNVISGGNWLFRCFFQVGLCTPLLTMIKSQKPMIYFPNSLYCKTIYREQNDYIPYIIYTKNFKKLYGPFLWMGFNCLKASSTSRRQFTFYHYVPRYSWYSFY